MTSFDGYETAKKRRESVIRSEKEFTIQMAPAGHKARISQTSYALLSIFGANSILRHKF